MKTSESEPNSSRKLPNEEGKSQVLHGENADPLSGVSLEQKISMMRDILGYTAVESQMFWQRSNVIASINFALIGLFAALLENNLRPEIMLIFGIFGFILSVAWRLVLRHGKFYAERWRADARELARSDTVLSNTYCALLESPRVQRPKGIKPSQVTGQLSFVFGLFWAVIAGVGFLQLLPLLEKYARYMIGYLCS